MEEGGSAHQCAVACGEAEDIDGGVDGGTCRPVGLTNTLRRSGRTAGVHQQSLVSIETGNDLVAFGKRRHVGPRPTRTGGSGARPPHRQDPLRAAKAVAHILNQLHLAVSNHDQRRVRVFDGVPQGPRGTDRLYGTAIAPAIQIPRRSGKDSRRLEA